MEKKGASRSRQSKVLKVSALTMSSNQTGAGGAIGEEGDESGRASSSQPHHSKSQESNLGGMKGKSAGGKELSGRDLYDYELYIQMEEKEEEDGKRRQREERDREIKQMLHQLIVGGGMPARAGKAVVNGDDEEATTYEEMIADLRKEVQLTKDRWELKLQVSLEEQQQEHDDAWLRKKESITQLFNAEINNLKDQNNQLKDTIYDREKLIKRMFRYLVKQGKRGDDQEMEKAEAEIAKKHQARLDYLE